MAPFGPSVAKEFEGPSICGWSAFRGIRLPKGWPERAKVAVIQCVALAHRAITYFRSYAINSDIERVRLAGQLDRDHNEIALLREEVRIKDARMAKLAPQRHPRHAARERMAILELKTARAWNPAETVAWGCHENRDNLLHQLVQPALPTPVARRSRSNGRVFWGRGGNALL